MRTELDQVMTGTAAVAAALAATIGESDPTFRDRFAKRLEEAYSTLKDRPGPGIQALEVISWTRQFVTGWDFVHGQGEPLFGD